MQSKDYRGFLRQVIEENRETKGYKKLLAASAGCQPAYLSQVLNGSVQLTPEQAERLGTWWGLTELEAEFFFTLVLHGRAGTPGLQERLREKLEQLRKISNKKDSTYDQPSLQENDRAFFYYSGWLYSAIHVLLTVPNLRSAAALSAHLQVEQSEVEEALKYLQKSGLAIRAEGGWRVTQATIHSPETNLSAEMHHRNWRAKAIEPGRRKARAVRYTSVHSISRADFIKVRNILDDAIKDTRKIISPSAEEEGACLLIDYFALGAKS